MAWLFEDFCGFAGGGRLRTFHVSFGPLRDLAPFFLGRAELPFFFRCIFFSLITFSRSVQRLMFWVPSFPLGELNLTHPLEKSLGPRLRRPPAFPPCRRDPCALSQRLLFCHPRTDDLIMRYTSGSSSPLSHSRNLKGCRHALAYPPPPFRKGKFPETAAALLRTSPRNSFPALPMICRSDVSLPHVFPSPMCSRSLPNFDLPPGAFLASFNDPFGPFSSFDIRQTPKTDSRRAASRSSN